MLGARHSSGAIMTRHWSGAPPAEDHPFNKIHVHVPIAHRRPLSV